MSYQISLNERICLANNRAQQPIAGAASGVYDRILKRPLQFYKKVDLAIIKIINLIIMYRQDLLLINSIVIFNKKNEKSNNAEESKSISQKQILINKKTLKEMMPSADLLKASTLNLNSKERATITEIERIPTFKELFNNFYSKYARELLNDQSENSETSFSLVDHLQMISNRAIAYPFEQRLECFSVAMRVMKENAEFMQELHKVVPIPDKRKLIIFDRAQEIIGTTLGKGLKDFTVSNIILFPQK